MWHCTGILAATDSCHFIQMLALKSVSAKLNLKRKQKKNTYKKKKMIIIN